MIHQERITLLTKKLELKHQCQDQIYVKGIIAVTDPDDAKRTRIVALKNNASFINCISKINDAQINNTEDSDVVMPMYNLLEYNKNYRKNNRQPVELLQG